MDGKGISINFYFGFILLNATILWIIDEILKAILDVLKI